MSHRSQTQIPPAKDQAEQAQRLAPPVMSAAEQTRLSWARRIRSAEELPDIYRSFMAALPAAGAFPYTVITPTFAGFVRRENEKLLCSVDNCLYVAEKIKGALTTTCFTFEDICYLEVGAVLLNDWLQLRGRTSAGTSAVVKLKFNAVTETLFTPFIEKIRGAANYSREVDRALELQKFDTADLLTFKFKNYARRSILPGARVVATVSQPEIRKTVVKILGRAWQRTAAMSHVLILTDHELIIVQDDPNSPTWIDDTRYGGVWKYLPLSKITALELTDLNTGLLAFHIWLPQDDPVEVLFAPDRRAVAARFLNQIIEWAPEATFRHHAL
jgi:hypothetical protein